MTTLERGLKHVGEAEAREGRQNLLTHVDDRLAWAHMAGGCREYSDSLRALLDARDNDDHDVLTAFVVLGDWPPSTRGRAQEPWSVTRSGWLHALELVRDLALDHGFFILTAGQLRCDEIEEALFLYEVEAFALADRPSHELGPWTLREILDFLNELAAS